MTIKNMATDYGSENLVQPDKLYQKESLQQYGNVYSAIVREILQNSNDANSTKVNFGFTDGEFWASDNGDGMSLEQCRERLLTLGATVKKLLATGGYGAAKKLLLYAWAVWLIKGQGFNVSGNYHGNIESFPDKSQKKGLFISASDEYFVASEFEFELKRLLELSSLPMTITVNGSKVEQGRKLRKNQIVKSYEWGKLYVHKTSLNDAEESGMLYIRTNGLYTAIQSVGSGYVFYLDIEGNTTEIMSESRDTLRWNIRQIVTEDLRHLIKNPAAMEEKPNVTIDVFGLNFEAKTIYHEDFGRMSMVGKGEFDTSEEKVVLYDLLKNMSAQEIFKCNGVAQETNNDTLQEITANVSPREDTKVIDTTWRKAYCVVNTHGKKSIVKNGAVMDKFAKQLEIWGATLNLVADAADLNRPIPGLIFGKDAESKAICQNGMEDMHVVAIRSDLVDADSFCLLEYAIHELAHYNVAGHSETFELERIRISELVGYEAMGILSAVNMIKKEKFQGRYWES